MEPETPACDETPTDRPKIWWETDPEIRAIRERTEREIYGDPPAHLEPDLADHRSVNSSSFVDDPSSNDDDPGRDTPTDRPKIWWETDPEIRAIRERTEREICGRPDRPEIDYPDPILADTFSRATIRELRDARDDLVRAKTRYENAIHGARDACLSWGQIGNILGVARQQLHRRYRDAVG